MSLCSKPGCANPGAAVLAYDYAARRASLEDPIGQGEVPPHLYVLCALCADTLTAPRGWTIEDRRSEPPLFLRREALTRLPAAAPEAIEEEPPAERRQLFFGSSA